jgi:DNA-binding protein YbaB
MKNIGQLMKQAQQMQAKMAEMLKIDKTLLDPEEIEVLEDLIVAAFNDARGKVSAHAEEEMQKLTGGLQLPGGMKLPF